MSIEIAVFDLGWVGFTHNLNYVRTSNQKYPQKIK